LGVGEGDLGTVPLLLSQENRSGSGVRERQVHSRLWKIVVVHFHEFRGRIQRKTWKMGPYAGVDYNLTFCPLQSRFPHIYHGQ
jgi:hypothetical protein